MSACVMLWQKLTRSSPADRNMTLAAFIKNDVLGCALPGQYQVCGHATASGHMLTRKPFPHWCPYSLCFWFRPATTAVGFVERILHWTKPLCSRSIYLGPKWWPTVPYCQRVSSQMSWGLRVLHTADNEAVTGLQSVLMIEEEELWTYVIWYTAQMFEAVKQVFICEILTNQTNCSHCSSRVGTVIPAAVKGLIWCMSSDCCRDQYWGC